jgi:hypothetical protein
MAAMAGSAGGNAGGKEQYTMDEVWAQVDASSCSTGRAQSRGQQRQLAACWQQWQALQASLSSKGACGWAVLMVAGCGVGVNQGSMNEQMSFAWGVLDPRASSGRRGQQLA